MHKPVIRGQLVQVIPSYPWPLIRLRIRLIDDHPDAGKGGELVTTSPVKAIDFERGVAHTQNSIYIFQAEP